MVESVAGAVIERALDAVLRKVSEGKKLSTEDLVVLMLGLFREIRKEVVDLRNDVNRRIDALYELVGKNYEALNRRIEETNKRIDELGRAVGELREDVNRRIDETNKRIDTLYELMGKIYETLIKQATTQKQ
ncbi:MAG: syntaxin domain-containing protein [Vulcanisaeta sp.]|nr:syntaxin domain-containing protein [Vulcanisaeta sp.]